MESRPLRVSKRMIDSVGPGVFVSEAGDGPLLFLLHGIGSSGSSWLPVLRPLAERYHLVMPDWRGHGSSGKPGGYTPVDYAEDLDQLFDAFDGPPIVLGHSLGALVATTWAMAHPAKVRAIILEDMPLTIDREGSGRLTKWAGMAVLPVEELIDQYQEENPTWTVEDCRRRAEVMTSSDVGVFTELRDLAMIGDGISMMTGVEVVQSPVHLIYGDVEAGSLISHEKAAAFVAQGPGMSATHIPGASHTIHRDSSGPFLADVFAFLESIGIGP